MSATATTNESFAKDDLLNTQEPKDNTSANYGGGALPNLERLAVFSLQFSSKGVAQKVKEVVGLDTGEIFLASDLRIQHLDLARVYSERIKVYRRLRVELQNFVTFLLLFRNHRRGITPGIKTICSWYAELKGCRSDNVARHVKKLKELGILVSDTTLGPLWQKTGARPKDVYSEEFQALNVRMFKAKRLVESWS